MHMRSTMMCLLGMSRRELTPLGFLIYTKSEKEVMTNSEAVQVVSTRPLPMYPPWAAPS